MRVALVFLIVLLAALAQTQTLILIPSHDAGPIGPNQDVAHATWTLWPRSIGNGENRLLSILSGMDWRSRDRDPGGYVRSVEDNLSQLPTIDPSVGLGSWPGTGRLHLLRVEGEHAWDKAAAKVKESNGRALIVELPDSPEQYWTRVWLLGKPWFDGNPTLPKVRIPGLIPARDLGRFLLFPEEASWKEADPARPIAPQRWLQFGHDIGPIVLLFAATFAVYVMGLSVYCMAREVQSCACLAMLRIVFLGPAILVGSSRLTSLGVPENWTGYLFACLTILPLASWGLGHLLAKVRAHVHPLAGECLVGFAVLLGCDPAWSIFSHILSPHPFAVSLEWFGSISAYIVALSYLLRSHYVSIVAAIAVAGAATLNGFGHDLPLGTATWIPILLAASPSIFAKKFRWFGLGLLGVWLALEVRSRGFTYAPDGLYPTYASRHAINCADHLAMVASPTFIALVSCLAISFIFRDHFLGHQFRRTIAFSPRAIFLYEHALLLFLCGIFIPIYLHAAVATALAATVILLFDGVRTP